MCNFLGKHFDILLQQKIDSPFVLIWCFIQTVFFEGIIVNGLRVSCWPFLYVRV